MAKASDSIEIQVGGRLVAVSNPGKLLFPEARPHQARPRQLLPGRRRRRVARRGRPALRAGALPQRRRRRVLLPEARAGHPARLGGGRHDPLSLGPHAPRKSCRAMRRRWPGWPTWAASNCIRTRCAPTTWTIPTNCGSTSTRCRASTWPQIVQVAAIVHEVLHEHGLVGLAQDLGLARHPRARAHRARAGASTRCAARRWRWRARSSGARRSSPPRRGGRRSGTASSSTTTRTRRTAPWRRRTRCGRGRMRACRRR